VAVTGPADRVANVTVKDSHGNYLIQLAPPFDIDLYPDSNISAPQAAMAVAKDGPLTAKTQLQGAFDPQVNGVVMFTIKKPGALVAKMPVVVANGEPINVEVTVGVHKDDLLFFDYSAYDAGLASKLVNKVVEVTFDGSTFSAPSAFHSAIPPGLFGPSFRGWGYAGYNANRDRATQPIVVGDLNIVFDKSSSYDTRTAKAYLYYPVPANKRWQGPDDLGYIGESITSSSRLGVDYISVPKPETIAGANGVSRLSRTTQQAVGVGASIGPLSATGSHSGGTSYSEVDYLDMNGDGFPDVVGNGHIQYTTPNRRARSDQPDGRRSKPRARK